MQNLIFYHKLKVPVFSNIIVKSKTNTYKAILLKADNIVYDSTSQGMPLLITKKALESMQIPQRIPLFLDHEDKVQNLVGEIYNIKFDDQYLKGEMEIYNTTEGKDIKYLIKNKKITDLSVKMLTEEHFDYIKKMNIVDKIKKLISCSLVLEGADKYAKIQL